MAAALGLVAAKGVLADTATWNGSVDANWDTTPNWTLGAGGSAKPTGNDDVIFGSPVPFGRETITLPASAAASSVTFATSYELIGGTLNLAGGSVMVADTASTRIDSSISGNAGLTKTGAGTLSLFGANSFSGGTIITGGTLVANSDAALGSAGSPVTLNGGTLTVSGTITRTMTLGPLGGTLRPPDFSGFSSTFAQPITGSGTLTVSGTGTGYITLSAVNTYSGGTLLMGGVLQISQDANLGAASGGIVASGINTYLRISPTMTFARPVLLNSGTLDFYGGDSAIGTLRVSSGLSGPGNVEFSPNTLFDGVGTHTGTTQLNDLVQIANEFALQNSTAIIAGRVDLTSLRTARFGGLSGNNTPYCDLYLGSTDLIVGGNGQNTVFSGRIHGLGSLTKIGTGSLQLATANDFIGPVSINSGTLTIGQNSVLGDAANGVTLDGGTLATTTTFTLPRSVLLNAGGGTLSVQSSTTASLSGVIAGPGGLTKSGTGTLVLSGNNTYVGGTTIKSGTLSIDSDLRLGSATGGLTLAGGALLATGPLSLSRAVQLATSGGTINTNGFDVSVLGEVGGIGGMTKSGAGTLILTGVGTYTGSTSITAGVLRAMSAGAFSPGSVVTVNSGTTLDLNSSDQSLAALSGAGAATLGNGMLTITNGGASTTFSGVISGAGGIIKSGSGTQKLSGANTYAGGTTITGGGLSVGSDAALGASSGGMRLNGGTLVCNASFTTARTLNIDTGGGTVQTDGSLTMTGPLAGSGTLTKTGSSILSLADVSGFAGKYVVSAGTLRLNSAATLEGLELGGTLDAGAAITLKGAIPMTSSGKITATRNITLENATISGSGMVSVAKGMLLSGSGTIAGAQVNNNGTISPGAGATLRLDGVNLSNLAATVLAGGGTTLEMSDSVVTGGVLKGTGTVRLLAGVAGNTADSLTIFNGSQIVQGGAATFVNVSNSGSIQSEAGGSLLWDGGIHTSSGKLTVGGNLNVQYWSSDGRITVNGGGVVNNDLSPLSLGGGSRTMVNDGGTVNLLDGTSVELAGGLLTNDGVVNGDVNAYYGSTVRGGGVFNGVVSLYEGARFVPSQSAELLVSAEASGGPGGVVSSNRLVVQGEITATIEGAQPGVCVMDAVAIVPGGMLDLKDRDLVLLAAGAATYDDMRQAIRDGRLMTSAVPASGVHPAALAPIDNRALHLLAWDGLSVSAGGGFEQMIVEYTYLGDVNGDGQVTKADLYNVLANMGHTGTWFDGDVDLDGVVTLADFEIVQKNIGAGDGSASGGAAMMTNFANVPEPGMVMGIMCSAMLLLRRRGAR